MPRAAGSHHPGRGGSAHRVVLSLGLLLQTTTPHLSEPEGVRVGTVLATARHGDLTLAIALAEEAGRPHAWFGLGSRLPGPLRLAVVRGDEQTDLLLHGRAPRWGAGFTLPGLRTIIIRADAGDPWGTLRHELAHLALHDVAKVRVPLWFDEGYAAVAAGEWSRLVALGLNLGVARGAVPGFFELDRALRSNQPTASTGYALAASAVSFLARRNPEQSLAPLLHRLEAGEGFEAAVLATTGWPLGRFEVEWQREVRHRYGLLMWVMAGGIWALVGIILLGAVWYRRRRDLPRRLALDEGWVVEPEPEEGPPPPLDRLGGSP